jgi:hypothetical protein
MKTMESDSKVELLAWLLVSWHLRLLMLAMINWANFWSWMLLKGWDGHKASIVIAYQPCQAKDTKVGMVYQQHH